jgi:CDP-4-dehydro-6-deoxyglucose reductase, E1|tara:strand:+ start:465 stop:1625 length:1161 start_codon:yes stop_codon:yes gene_type:complete
MKKIDLIKNTIDNGDIDKLIDWLKTYPRLTKGPLTKEFESKWSSWLGCKYSVFVNSGSSANLLMLYVLQLSNKLKNKKICVPGLCWATDLSPVIQLNMEPILVDCNLTNLSVDLDHLEKIFINESPSVLLLVSVLGLSPDMKKINQLCNKYNVILLEDNCESQGTTYDDVKLGNFGLMSSFSTYFGHTMSTIEGGIISTNDEEIYHKLLQLRSHGWDRDLPIDKQTELRDEWGVSEFSSLYTFYEPGFNLRSTDLQAFIGINQLLKVDSMIEARRKNFKYFQSRLADKIWFPKILDNTSTSSFAIPVILKDTITRDKLITELNDNNITSRPLIAGSMGHQPFYVKSYGSKTLKNCHIIDHTGMYVPNHDKLSINDIDRICDILIKY